MITLILVRHGQTDWNRETRIQGQSNIPLNEEGKRQAERIARQLSDKKIDTIYTSKLKRAYQTAHIIARPHSLRVIKDPRLNEIIQGDWEGLTLNEARKRYPVRFKKWLTIPLQTKPPGGESLENVKKRVDEALDEIRKRHSSQTVAIVAHEVVNAIILSICERIDLKYIWDLHFSNGSYEVIEVKN
ncbi:MAG: alpha-ribazole phosphatase [Candidatus Aerophobetes bacterium]|nr:alpha-ribazole phosphatase [Candidatus Aerophobetes bacterium]